LVHRSAIDRHETRFALQLLRDQLGQRVYPVHRLDKPTSGVLLFGLNSDAAAAVAWQFEQRLVDKRYLAVVRGYCPEQGVVDHSLRDKPDSAARDRATRRPAREAHTRFRRLATVELPYAVDRYPSSRYSLVLLQPLTGRRHQLRRHMKHLGHPIIGDAKHGKGVHNRFFKLRFGCSRLLLACTGLAFNHPRSGERIQVAASPGIDFENLLVTFGWSTDDA
jgi:tRNA pseudouridine65 synthase